MSVTLNSRVIKELGDKAQDLSKLKDHPSWEVLRSEFEAKRLKYMDRLAARLMRGGLNANPLDQREIDYQRGFFDGAQWILDNPEFAESSLENALKRMEEHV